MILLRKLLFPFAVLYGFATRFRNFLFDIGIMKSRAFDVPVIAVGNLSVGGTGKTPQIEYLIRLLSSGYRVATLSRGYKRQSDGFLLADENSDAKTIGDEPFQFYRKFPDIRVAVDSDRKNGIEKLMELRPKPEIVLLDDAFQHRQVKAGLYILLTAYGDLYCDDWMLPTGNLREGKKGAARADIIVVTKCPQLLSPKQQLEIGNKLKISGRQQLYFTSIQYDDISYGENEQLKVTEIKRIEKVLVAGIAKPDAFFKHLQNENDVAIEFPDHHQFSAAEISEIVRTAGNNPIVTTEKDYVRLAGTMEKARLFYLPIQTALLSNSEKFDKTILDYVGKSCADR